MKSDKKAVKMSNFSHGIAIAVVSFWCLAATSAVGITLTFNTAGGTTIAPITQDKGTEVTIPADPIRSGYTFGGWEPMVPAFMPVDDLTCTAQWQAQMADQTITFPAIDDKFETDTVGLSATAPKDVPPEVWAKIGQQVERQIYAFNAEGRASNREQDFHVAAEAAGLSVNGILRLRATALNGEPLPEAAPGVIEITPQP